MDITPLINKEHQLIQAYGPGRFTISGTVFEHAVFVRPEATEAWPAPQTVAAIGAADFAASLTQGRMPDVILFGTGGTSARLDPAVRRSLRDQGIGVDAMDTGAACRTYNVLMAEGRDVCAFLLPI